MSMPEESADLTIVVGSETEAADEEMSGEMLASSMDATENSAPVEPAPADAPVEPAAPAIDVAALTAERDAAVGRAAQMDVDMQALKARNLELEACVSDMSSRIATFELSAALSANGLPSSAGMLVKLAYDKEMASAKMPMSIGEWLTAAMSRPEYAALTLMRGPQMSDPRGDVTSVGAGSKPGMVQFPSYKVS